MDKPIKGKDGQVWRFLIWSGVVDDIYVKKIFFWDTDKKITGVVELKDNEIGHINKLKDRMKKIANDSEYRDKFLNDIKFPIEQYY